MMSRKTLFVCGLVLMVLVMCATGVSGASPVSRSAAWPVQRGATTNNNRGNRLAKKKSAATLGGNDAAAVITASSQANATPVVIPWQRIIPLSLVLPWMYFVCGAMNMPTLPRYVNYAISSANGRTTAQSMQVSSKGAEVYGNINGIDSFFTFLSVNLIGVLSDHFGRKIFMMMASMGLALSHLCMSFASTPMQFYVSSFFDGLTSCMLSQSQAYIADILCLQEHFPMSTHNNTTTDVSVDSKKAPMTLGIALSRFQGICIGVAYLIGIPLGAKIAKTYSFRSPLQVSAALGMINMVLIGLFLPNLQKYQKFIPSKESANNNHNHNNGAKKIDWSLANPFGAIYLFRRSPQLFIGGIVYFLVNFAHSSLQVNWINYLQYRYGWSATLSGSTLMIVGLVVAILPSIFVPLVGKMPAIKYSLLIHSMISIFLGWNKHPMGIFLTMPILAAGASVMPMLLGYLTEQVPNDEVGNLQGAADTLRTISCVVAAPLSAKIFSMYLGLASAPKDAWYRPICELAGPGIALYFTAMFSFAAYVIFNFIQTLPSDQSSVSPTVEGKNAPQVTSAVST